MTITTGTAARFEATYGRPPSGSWSAPGRVNLIGEHTDYNDGFVLPIAIDQRTVVALGIRDDGMLRVTSAYAGETVEMALSELAPEQLTGWSAYPLGAAWALGQFGADLENLPGADLYIESTVPVGAGLSSSAAIESAVAIALDETWEIGLDRRSLARVGQVAENTVVGAPTGIMDQSASLLGKRDHAVFLDCRNLDAQLVPLGFAEAGLELLIIDTGVSHAHATSGYAVRRASCEKGAMIMGVAALRDLSVDILPRARELLDSETFRRVRHVVTENQRVLDTVAALRSAGPLAIGELLDASHLSMRDDFEISVPELDLAVSIAQQNGAIGARMTGGGFGGSAIALVRAGDVQGIQLAIEKAFVESGYRKPTMFTVTASDGAQRD